MQRRWVAQTSAFDVCDKLVSSAFNPEPISELMGRRRYGSVGRRIRKLISQTCLQRMSAPPCALARSIRTKGGMSVPWDSPGSNGDDTA